MPHESDSNHCCCCSWEKNNYLVRSVRKNSLSVFLNLKVEVKISDIRLRIQLSPRAISIALASIIISGCSKNESIKFLNDGISQFPLNPITKEKSEKLFVEIKPEHSGINFQMELGDFFSRTKEYMFATPMGGVATGDYDGDSLPDIYLTSPTNGNRLYKNKGNYNQMCFVQNLSLIYIQ